MRFVPRGLRRLRASRALSVAACGAALSLVVTACGGSSLGGGGGDQSSGTLKVGMLATLSGTEASSGTDMVNGFKLYLAQHGNKLGGRKVELDVGDTKGDPSAGLAAAQRLIRQDGVKMLAGVTVSPVALAVRNLVTDSKVPLIISNAGADALTTTNKSPYVWRVSFANCQPDYAMGPFVHKQVGDGGVFVIGRDDAAGHEQTQGFVTSFTADGGKIAGTAFPPFGTTQNYQPFLSQIQQSGAKAVFAFFAGGEAVSFVQQYAQFGLKGSIPLYAAGYLTADGHVVNAEGDAAVGLQTALNYSPELDNAPNKTFVAAYQKAYKTLPNLYAAQSWDAAMFMDKGLQKTKGDASADKLNDAWANIGTLKSPRGEFTMSKDHNAVQDWYLLEAQKTGKGGGYSNVVKQSLGKVTYSCNK